MLPNFLIIGGARCATTWVHECLSQHPMVYTAETKEVDFFSYRYDRGLEHYGQLFEAASGDGIRAVGEASTSYLSHTECPARIARDLPGVKLIAIVRNPVARAFSHYLMFQKNHPERSFEQALDERPGLLNDGLYHEHLARYAEYFDRDRILVLFFDDIKKDPAVFLRRIYAFLDIDPEFTAPSRERPVNLVAYPRTQRLLRSIGLGWTIELAKATPLDPILRRLAHKKKIKSYPTMKPETRVKLRKYYEAPNRRLAQETGRDLSHWK